MEIHLSSGCRVPRRAARRNDRIQNAAGALGEGTDPDRQKNSAAGFEKRPAVSSEARSLVSPDRQHELSADGDPLGAFASRHGYSLLSGLVPDALHRHSTLPRINVFDLQFLSGFAARTLSAHLAASASVSTCSDGTR